MAKRPTNLRMSEELWRRVQAYGAKIERSGAWVVEKALLEYRERHGQGESKGEG